MLTIPAMSKKVAITCDTLQATERAARAFARVLRGGEIVSLEGDLGAGKTFFTRAVAEAMGIREHVTSPTFVLQKTYRVPAGEPVAQLVHYDLYRLGSYDELADIGFEDLPPDSAAFVEWGDRFADAYHGEVVRVALEYVGEFARRITFAFPKDIDAARMREAIRLSPPDAGKET